MRTRTVAHGETKQRILEIARRMVIKDGHARLSLRAIAREAGFSAPSLYEYFDGKQAIIDAIAAEIAGSLRLALVRRLEEARGERAALIALGTGYVAWARKHPQDFMLLFGRIPSKRRSLSVTAPTGSPYELVLGAVEAAAAAGVIAGGRQRLEEIAYALWAAVHGMAMLQLTHLAGFDADFEAADRLALIALIAGFAPM